MEYAYDGDISCNWSTWNSPHWIEKGIGTVGKNRDHSEYNIVEIDQNSEKNPGDPKRLAVTQNPVKETWLAKTRKE